MTSDSFSLVSKRQSLKGLTRGEGEGLGGGGEGEGLGPGVGGGGGQDGKSV